MTIDDILPFTSTIIVLVNGKISSIGTALHDIIMLVQYDLALSFEFCEDTQRNIVQTRRPLESRMPFAVLSNRLCHCRRCHPHKNRQISTSLCVCKL